MRDAIPAPGGWGWVPGAPLNGCSADGGVPIALPRIRGLSKMPPRKRAAAVRAVVATLPGAVDYQTLAKRYGIPRGTAFDIARGVSHGRSYEQKAPAA